LRPARKHFLTLLAVLGLLVHGCSHEPIQHLIPNVPPSVKFTLAPVSADRDNPVFYAYRVFWSGDDPDGRVDHFDYAIDPGPKDTVWVSTTRSEEVLFFRSTTPDGKPGVVSHSEDFHVLVIRAVDDKGAMSARKSRAFYSYTVAPSVQLTAPVPSRLLSAEVPPSLSIHWQGVDPDGQVRTTPVRYRYRLLPFNRASDLWMVSDPDSLYRRELADSLASWSTIGGDTTSATFTNLTPKSEYLFMLIGYDEAGARSPVLSLDENLLMIEVNPAATLGPRLHLFNGVFDFTYLSGGYTTDKLVWIPVEAPADRPFPLNWEAFTSAGATIERYRWGVDLNSVLDETPRSDEEHDYSHWSRGGPLEQSCNLVGLAPGTHLIYVEAKDNNGYASLGIVALTLVVPSFNHDLLVVDDTRLEVDKFTRPIRPDAYTDVWPSATELDTFLFARGGVPWRATQDTTHLVPSIPGIFAGYAFDTLGTRLGLERPSSGVSLGKLGQYRHVVWMVDRRGATGISTNSEPPITVLRFASSRGQASALAAYVQAGGSVWLMGGGAGTASITQFNDTRNDAGPNGEVYDNTANELVQGRLMFDGAHWRSTFSATRRLVEFRRAPSADAIAATPWDHFDHWSGTTLRAPDYGKLPAQLRPRDRATDPLPPTRRPNQGSLYYPTTYSVEYLTAPNIITEDVDPGQGSADIASTLDTLIEANSFLLLRSPAPTMTYYHGADVNRFVFSGFAPWDFRRDDCITLTDFVLQDLWGLDRTPVDRGSVPAGVAGSRPGSASTLRPSGTVVTRAGYR